MPGVLRSAPGRAPLSFPWIAALAIACGDPVTTPPDGGPGDSGPRVFDDRTLDALETRDDYAALVRAGGGLQTVKFVVTAFHEARRDVVFMDANFYTLHDEWYWYRLLNGQPIAGDEETTPVRGFRFDTIDLVYAWAEQQSSLPLDLAFTDDRRLYSPRFYQLALDVSPRKLGLGSVLHVPASASGPEKWAFELEYSDDVTHEELVTFFAALERELPPDVAPIIKWVVRSPVQETLAQRMEAERLLHHDRILRYRELAVVGAKEVYGEGIAAGRVRVVRAGDSLEGGNATDVLVLEQVPDYLPPCAALITSVPQTPLAHVAVLARNRGIPNFYLGGAAFDPFLDQLGRVNAPVVVRAASPDRVDLVALTEVEYRDYQNVAIRQPIAVEEVPLDAVELAYDLESLDPNDADRWRPIIGGKSTGFLSVLAAPSVTHPDRPVGISIKPYVEHIAPLVPRIQAMITHPKMQTDARARYLILEGEEDFSARFASPADGRWLTEFKRMFPRGTLLGDLTTPKGLRGLIRDQPIAPATLAAITATLRANFGDYALGQGLRFRSSSNAEDIEGFNGAGLYDSNTGYLDAAQLPASLQERTVEWAIKKTWASYWAFEAYEERRLELVDHLSGAMGVTVHARFDDDLEASNGVIVATILPPRPLEGPLATRAEAIVVEIDAQHGAVSVTNPDPLNPQLPEVSKVILDHGASSPRIERVRRSTLSPEGRVVLEDAKLLSLFAQVREVTEAWLARERAATRKREQAQRTLTLDFEYREVKPGWPAMRSGETRPSRLIVKQARSLDPGIRSATPYVRSLPFPKDVLVRARKILRTSCRSAQLDLTVIDAYTDPLSSPDLGHSELPFVASVAILPREDLPALGFVRGATVTLSHLEMEARHTPDLQIDALEAARARVERLELGENGHFRVARGAGEVVGDAVCTPVIVRATPREYLFALLEQKLR